MDSQTQTETNTEANTEKLVSAIGEFIEYWGFKRVHGKIWTHIFLSERPLDAADLMKRLKISKALVSISVKDLIEYSVILKSGKSKKGTQTYTANPNLADVITHVLKTRERVLLNRISAAVSELSTESSFSDSEKSHFCEVRIGFLRLMLDEATRILDGILEMKEIDTDFLKNIQNAPVSANGGASLHSF